MPQAKQSSESVSVASGTTVLNVTVHSPTNENGRANQSSPAETVLLLHGGPGVPEEFEFLVATLISKYQVIKFEQRGLGKSINPGGDYSIESYIEDIEAIAKHFELEKFHVFGQSWGGLYAQIYAEVHPERLRSMFLSSPSSGTGSLWEETEKEVLEYNRQRCRSQWTFLLMGWYSLLGALGMDFAMQNLFVIVFENYNHDFGENAPIVTKDDLKAVKAVPINATRQSILQYKALSTMETSSFPIQITYGDTDIYGPSQNEVLRRYPTAQRAIIPTCGHLPWWHNPEEFTTILNRFYSLQDHS